MLGQRLLHTFPSIHGDYMSPVTLVSTEDLSQQYPWEVRPYPNACFREMNAAVMWHHRVMQRCESHDDALSHQVNSLLGKAHNFAMGCKQFVGFFFPELVHPQQAQVLRMHTLGMF